jgi:hypothetical protein
VTRTEYDELKHRVDYLEDLIARIPTSSHSARSPPSPPLSSHSYRTQATARVSYPVHPSPSQPGYKGMPSPYSPARSEQHSSAMSHGTAPPQSPTYSHSIVHTEHPGRSAATVSPSHARGPRALSTSPLLSSSSRLRETERTPGSRRASLSLAAITTPYTPPETGASYSHHQPKNRQAQMPTLLGQRLRQVSAHTGPAIATLLQAPSATRTIVNRRRLVLSRRKLGEVLRVRRLPAVAPRHCRVVHRRRRRLPHFHIPRSAIGCLDRCLGTLTTSDSCPLSSSFLHRSSARLAFR